MDFVCRLLPGLSCLILQIIGGMTECPDVLLQYGEDCYSKCPSETKQVDLLSTCVKHCPKSFPIEFQSHCHSFCPSKEHGVFNNTCKLQSKSVNRTINDIMPYLFCPVGYCIQPKEFCFQLRCYNMCPNGTFILDKTCVQKCPNTKPYISRRTCVANCSGDNAFLDGDICSQKCSINPLRYGNTCMSQCPQSTFLSNNTCVLECPPSSPFIMRDNDHQYCLSTCPSFTVINGSECNLVCPIRTVLYNRTCFSSCPNTNPFMLIRQTLYSKIIICLAACPVDTVVERLTCTEKCSSDMMLFNNTCFENCPQLAPYIINKRLFGELKNIHFAAIPASNLCTELCPDTLLLHNFTCVDRCPLSNMYIFDRKCVSNCPDLHPFINENECVSECKYFYQNETCVFSCPYQMKIYNKQCLLDCPNDTFELRNFPYIYCVKSCPRLEENKRCVYVCSNEKTEFNGTCVEQCPSGYYKKRGAYRSICVKRCPEFHNFSICVSACGADQKVYNAFCVYDCPDASFQLNPKTCVPSCPFANNGTQCVDTCTSNLKLHNGTCIDVCPKEFLKYSNLHNNETVCYYVCPHNTFMFKDVCYDKCPDEVRFILNESCISQCPTTQPLYVESNMHCVSDCTHNTVKEVSTCRAKCSKDFQYLMNGTCNKKCPPSFPVAVLSYGISPTPRADYICSDACETDMVLFNHTCLHKCPLGFLKYNKSCHISCPKSRPLKLKSSDEVECVSKCPDNNTKTVFCEFACPLNMFLFHNSCVANCPSSHLFTLNDGSSRCLKNCPKSMPFHLESNVCVSTCPLSAKFVLNSSCFSTCPESHPYTYQRKSSEPHIDSYKCYNNCSEKHLIYKLTCIPEYDCRGIKIDGKCMDKCPSGMYQFLNTKECFRQCILPNYAIINDSICAPCYLPKVIYNSRCYTTCPNATVPIFEWPSYICKETCDDGQAFYNDTCVYCVLYDKYEYEDQCVSVCPKLTYILQTKLLQRTCIKMYQQFTFLGTSIVSILVLLVTLKVVFFQTEPDQGSDFKRSDRQTIGYQQQDDGSDCYNVSGLETFPMDQIPAVQIGEYNGHATDIDRNNATAGGDVPSTIVDNTGIKFFLTDSPSSGNSRHDVVEIHEMNTFTNIAMIEENDE